MYQEYEKNNVSVSFKERDHAGQSAHLDVSCSPIEVEMQVFDLAIICKFILEFFLSRFFVDVCDEHDPAFDGCWFRFPRGGGQGGRDEPRQ